LLEKFENISQNLKNLSKIENLAQKKNTKRNSSEMDQTLSFSAGIWLPNDLTMGLNFFFLNVIYRMVLGMENSMLWCSSYSFRQAESNGMT
jgi:hypothetical protein